MRIVLTDIATGDIELGEVPPPELRPGGILVRTAFSAVSAGTERAQIATASKSIVGKALARPDLARQVLDYARSNGVRAAYRKVRSRLECLSPLGYSCSGIVVSVGEGVQGFACGDRVACAGAGYANHAEINWVPQNLAVRVPENVSLEAAALSTMGAIALQGLRQSQVALGECVAVIGVGLVGVLTVQLARSAGCRVVAIDLDRSRAQQAVTPGAGLGLVSSDPHLEETVRTFSRYGVDAAIVAADTRSTAPVELAARLLRDRGRIVIVGTVGMDIPRAQLYRKELSVVMSRSYGPGRYDPAYEEGGHDYPVGYVRWTEQRNMEAFLDLLSGGGLDVSPLLQHCADIAEAGTVFGDLHSGGSYTTILQYKEEDPGAGQARPRLVTASPRRGEIRIGCIGAGTFAREHILPRLAGVPGVFLDSVATASGFAADAARRKFGFAQASTPSQVLENPAVNAVFVLSRHQTHSMYVVQALHNNKAVFVEKPLAVSRAQLEEVKAAYEQAANPFVMAGFNRRFAPSTERVREFFADRREPMVVHIRVNAGYLARDHWTQQEQEGGRIIGELCHFVDWARFVIGQPIGSISAVRMPDGERYRSDNLAAILSFADGSIANLLYLANGDRDVGKEYYEVFCQGRVARLDDFRRLELSSGGRTQRTKFTQDKGHKREVQCVLECMKSGKESPIAFGQIIEVSEATFRIKESLNGGLSLRQEVLAVHQA